MISSLPTVCISQEQTGSDPSVAHCTPDHMISPIRLILGDWFEKLELDWIAVFPLYNKAYFNYSVISPSLLISFLILLLVELTSFPLLFFLLPFSFLPTLLPPIFHPSSNLSFPSFISPFLLPSLSFLLLSFTFPVPPFRSPTVSLYFLLTFLSSSRLSFPPTTLPCLLLAFLTSPFLSFPPPIFPFLLLSWLYRLLCFVSSIHFSLPPHCFPFLILSLLSSSSLSSPSPLSSLCLSLTPHNVSFLLLSFPPSFYLFIPQYRFSFLLLLFLIFSWPNFLLQSFIPSSHLSSSYLFHRSMSALNFSPYLTFPFLLLSLLPSSHLPFLSTIIPSLLFIFSIAPLLLQHFLSSSLL